MKIIGFVVEELKWNGMFKEMKGEKILSDKHSRELWKVTKTNFAIFLHFCR
jgi:hypothetical protein